MKTILIDQLRRLELQHSVEKKPVRKGRLRVYYGWAKLGR